VYDKLESAIRQLPEGLRAVYDHLDQKFTGNFFEKIDFTHKQYTPPKIASESLTLSKLKTKRPDL
jgi:hypothetical protein